MKASLWALILSVFLVTSAKGQEPIIPPATHSLATNTPNKIANLRTKAEKGDAAAQYNLGVCYYRGQGVPQDYAEAAKWYRKAADQGYAAAQCKLGVCYHDGQGVPQDYAEAVKWVRKAAEQDEARGECCLGDSYDAGQGVPQDYVEAVNWYRKAAEQGYAAAQSKLGACYLNGQGVSQDSVEAVKWVRKAAEQGEALSEAFLGSFYDAGQGVPQDYLEAVKWLRKASEQGEANAQFLLGLSYKSGLGVAQDYSEAVKWFRKAAEQGSVLAQGGGLVQDNLGDMYQVGQGVPQDYAEAVKWYRQAAEQGYAAAQSKLGVCYLNGQGVPQDYAEAVKWVRKAAEQGEARAQYNLGVFCWRGEGVPKNDIESYKWLSLAAAQGYTESARQRDSLAQTMSREEIVEGQRRAAAFVPRKQSADDSINFNLPALPRFADTEQKASGTGFFVSEDGFFLTAFHVVADAARIAIRTKAGTFAATLVKADAANDVALLKVAGIFSALPVASSSGVKLGESVFTIGFPNIELQGFAPKLTKGEISSLAGMQDDPREFQVSVPVQPGNSGGPLVNQYGNVVGIVEARLADVSTLETTGLLPQNVNYAMKSSVLNLLLESLPEISAKLPAPNPTKDRKFEEVEQETEKAVALVLVY